MDTSADHKTPKKEKKEQKQKDEDEHPLLLYKWHPEKTRPQSAGRLVCPRSAVCVVHAVADYMSTMTASQSAVTWNTYRDPNPGELLPVELVCATDPKSGIHPCQVIAEACTVALQQVEQMIANLPSSLPAAVTTANKATNETTRRPMSPGLPSDEHF